MENKNVIKYRSYDRIWGYLVSILFIIFVHLSIIKNSSEVPIILYLIFFSWNTYIFINSFVYLDFKDKILFCNFVPHSEIKITEIKSIERIDSFYDKYTNKLNKIEIVFEEYNDIKFSTIENEKLIQTLIQLNPNIRI